MLLWIAFAGVTAVVLAAVLAPLARPAPAAPEAASAALDVYRHQLDELAAEQARGLVAPAEAEAARIEVSRRLLARAGAEERAERPAAWPARRPVALAVGALVPLLTVFVYLQFGTPGLPSFPASARPSLPLEQANVAELIAKVEARLRESPDEGEGWDAIAPVYLKLGRYRDAANAYARAAALQGETVKRLGGFVEATVLAADGVVTEPARLACEKILKLEPGRPEARLWLALAKEQDGKLAEALADYKGLLAEAPADAPWRAGLTERIGELSRRTASAPESARGPSATDIAAAEKLSPEQRAQMVAQMVEGLAERLKRDGRDLAGWQRLVNAYVVLGRKKDAEAALATARRNFTGDDKALGQLSELARTLGLGS